MQNPNDPYDQEYPYDRGQQYDQGYSYDEGYSYNQEPQYVQKKDSYGMVLGVLSIIFFLFSSFVGLILGIIGLVRSKRNENTVVPTITNTVGIADSILAMPISAVPGIICRWVCILPNPTVVNEVVCGRLFIAACEKLTVRKRTPGLACSRPRVMDDDVFHALHSLLHVIGTMVFVNLHISILPHTVYSKRWWSFRLTIFFALITEVATLHTCRWSCICGSSHR